MWSINENSVWTLSATDPALLNSALRNIKSIHVYNVKVLWPPMNHCNSQISWYDILGRGIPPQRQHDLQMSCVFVVRRVFPRDWRNNGTENPPSKGQASSTQSNLYFLTLSHKSSPWWQWGHLIPFLHISHNLFVSDGAESNFGFVFKMEETWIKGNQTIDYLCCGLCLKQQSVNTLCCYVFWQKQDDWH